MLIVPRALLARRGGRSWLTTITSPADAGAAAGTVSSRPPAGHRAGRAALERRQPERAAVGAGGGHRGRPAAIRAGQLSKVVLARDLQATASAPIDARMLLARLAARYPDCYIFSCSGPGRRDPRAADPPRGQRDQLAGPGRHRAARRQPGRGRRARRRPAVLGQERRGARVRRGRRAGRSWSRSSAELHVARGARAAAAGQRAAPGHPGDRRLAWPRRPAVRARPWPPRCTRPRPCAARRAGRPWR